jgi:hypothetical protein
VNASTAKLQQKWCEAVFKHRCFMWLRTIFCALGILNPLRLSHRSDGNAQTKHEEATPSHAAAS